MHMKNLLLFILLVTLTIMLGILSKTALDGNNLVVEYLSNYYTQSQIENMLNFQHKFELIGYLLIPILLFIKISLISVILDGGCFFIGKKLKFSEVFNFVVKAEFIFLFVIVFKILWFYIIQQDFSLEDFQYFYPLSALNLVGYEDLPKWFIYPLQVINLFELTYWFILAFQVKRKLEIDTIEGLNVVASSYGVSLVVWVVAVMFFTLNFS